VSVAAVFLPLLGSIVAGFFGRWIGDRGAQLATCLAMLASAAAGVVLFVEVALNGSEFVTPLFSFIDAGKLQVDWALKFDALSAVMVAMVTVVSAMIHIYSVGYMAGDPSIPRFMSYLSLFTFFMLALVTSENFVQLFFGWEGVGLLSYLLIGFWYDRPSANAAAIKAFVMNRIGDFGFALGIFAVFSIFGTLHFDEVFREAPNQAGGTMSFLGWQVPALTVTCILLFVGAMGKSAQIGLHTWLPDAMEGPTPVSALIHAATMVTAGVSAYSASIFHLTTHAFFKALLFLGAGSVIHAMSGEQDMRKMGGLWRLIWITYVLMWIGSLALAGIWPFAGYYSKDTIIEAAWASGTGVGLYGFVLGTFAAFLTAFYSWRLLFLTFHGEPRADPETLHHVHESPPVMILPLVVLAAGAVAAGFLGFGLFVGDGREQFWRDSILVLPEHGSLEAAHHVPAWVSYLPLLLALAGIAVAYLAYIRRPAIPALAAERFRPLYLFLLNKWYFDELYDFVFVRGAMLVGFGLWKGGDGAVIDGLGPDGLAATTQRAAVGTSRLQTGYVYHYAFAMLIGVVILVSWYLGFQVLRVR
jgi:NADH-quinone oxidoreductase subunit L